MGIFNWLPYVNLHELNLDWLLKKVGELEEEMKGISGVYSPVIIEVDAGELEADTQKTVAATCNKSAAEVSSLMIGSGNSFTPTVRIKANNITFIPKIVCYESGAKNSTIIYFEGGYNLTEENYVVINGAISITPLACSAEIMQEGV